MPTSAIQHDPALYGEIEGSDTHWSAALLTADTSIKRVEINMPRASLQQGSHRIMRVGSTSRAHSGVPERLKVQHLAGWCLQAQAGKEARAEAEQLLGQLKGAQTDLSRTQQRLDKEQAAGDADRILLQIALHMPRPGNVSAGARCSQHRALQ